MMRAAAILRTDHKSRDRCIPELKINCAKMTKMMLAETADYQFKDHC